MSTELFRKYIDIINESSENTITDDRPRHEVAKAMGYARYYLSQLYPEFANAEAYTKNPQNLKGKLNIITRALAPVERYDGTPGLYANNPTAEYRLINTPEVNMFVNNLEYIYKLIDNKQVEEVKKLFVNAEKSLLDSAIQIFKAMGNTDYKTFNSYFK